MIVRAQHEVYSDLGHWVHLRGTEVYGKRIAVGPGTSAEDFEEVSELPADTSGYALRVEALIRERYTVSDELAILRQRDTKPEEFEQYNAYCEECKMHAKQENQE